MPAGGRGHQQRDAARRGADHPRRPPPYRPQGGSNARTRAMSPVRAAANSSTALATFRLPCPPASPATYMTWHERQRGSGVVLVVGRILCNSTSSIKCSHARGTCGDGPRRMDLFGRVHAGLRTSKRLGHGERTGAHAGSGKTAPSPPRRRPKGDRGRHRTSGVFLRPGERLACGRCAVERGRRTVRSPRRVPQRTTKAAAPPAAWKTPRSKPATRRWPASAGRGGKATVPSLQDLGMTVAHTPARTLAGLRVKARVVLAFVDDGEPCAEDALPRSLCHDLPRCPRHARHEPRSSWKPAPVAAALVRPRLRAVRLHADQVPACRGLRQGVESRLRFGAPLPGRCRPWPARGQQADAGSAV